MTQELVLVLSGLSPPPALAPVWFSLSNTVTGLGCSLSSLLHAAPSSGVTLEEISLS